MDKKDFFSIFVKCALVFIICTISISGCTATEDNRDNVEIDSGVLSNNYKETDLMSMVKAYYVNKNGVIDGLDVCTIKSDNDSEYIPIKLFVTYSDHEDTIGHFFIKTDGVGYEEGASESIDFSEFYEEGVDAHYLRFVDDEFERFLSVWFNKEVGTVTREDFSAIKYFAYIGGEETENYEFVNCGKEKYDYQNSVFYNTLEYPVGESPGDISYAWTNGSYAVGEKAYEYSDSCSQVCNVDCVWAAEHLLPYINYFDKLEAIYLFDCWLPENYYISGNIIEEFGDNVWDYQEYKASNDITIDSSEQDAGEEQAVQETEGTSFEQSIDDISDDSKDEITVSFNMGRDSEGNQFAKIYGFKEGVQEAIWTYFTDYYPANEGEDVVYEIGREGDVYNYVEGGQVVSLDVYTGERIE